MRAARAAGRLLRAALAVGAGAALSAWAAVPPAPAPAGPASNVLLVTIDTLRADRFAPPGAVGGAMPELQRFAGSGTVFSHAYAHTPLTVPSHATLLTGLDPRHHGVRDNLGYRLADRTATLASILAARGWRCAAFVGGAPLVGRPDFGRGFEVYDDRMTRAAGGGDGPPSERRAGEVVAAALRWLRALDPADRFFLWVHFYDPHDPYEPPPGFTPPGGSAYDGEVRYADATLGDLLAQLPAGRLARTVVIVSGDHGEMLGERGEATHGIFLYEPALRTPLVISAPGGTGQVVDRATPLCDVAPTALDLLGVTPPAGLDGVSLAGLVRGRGAAPAARPFYIETLHPRRRYGWSALYGLLDWPSKFIDAPAPELFDLRADARESRNLLPVKPVAPWKKRLAEWRVGASRAAPETVDPERLARLSSLGYVGGASGPSPEAALDDRPRPDPKAGVRALPALDRGLAALAAGDHRRAAIAFDEALAMDPDNVLALHNRGLAAVEAGDLKTARTWLERAAAADPYSDNVQNDLGLVRGRLGDKAGAEAAFQRALAINPDFTVARFNWAIALHRLGRRADALAQLREVRRREPGFPKLDETIREVERTGAR